MTPPETPLQPKGRSRRKFVVLLLLALALTGGGVGAAMLTGFLPHPVVAGDPKASGHDDSYGKPTVRSVKVVHPRRDPALQIVVEQLATVEAFYKADLRARASGVVKAVHKNIGDRVRRGEMLIEIDVPDLEKEVAQKQSVVEQRKQEQRAAKSKLKNAEAMREVGKATILQKKSEVKQAAATRVLREKRVARYKQLANRDSLGPDVVEEEERNLDAAVAGEESAKLAVTKAEADLKEKDADFEAALVDIDLKGALIDVAGKDLERTRALADYARITAPFDGEVTERNVDPGSFVQNATTGQSEVLISVARTDMVTIVARIPDNAAPFITRETEMSFDITELPGVTVAGHVTRFSPSIQNKDRTMRVEVDLPPTAAVKGEVTGPRLLPGMSGTMRLRLQQFGSSFVLPATAIYSRSGKPYLLEVVDGVTHQVPIRVQMNDGTVAKVVALKKVGNREVLQELTGSEEVVTSRQLEVGDGQTVKSALTNW